jgi:hypothetical protein
MSNSNIIILVLSDSFLINEWRNKSFRNHLRYLVSRRKVRLICIQLHDVVDEEVNEYLRSSLQIERVISLENDEFLFWTKLNYYLWMNKCPRNVAPINYEECDDKIDQDVERNQNINRPIVHLLGYDDPIVDNNNNNNQCNQIATSNINNDNKIKKKRKIKIDNFKDTCDQVFVHKPEPVSTIIKLEKSENEINYERSTNYSRFDYFKIKNTNIIDNDDLYNFDNC